MATPFVKIDKDTLGASSDSTEALSSWYRVQKLIIDVVTVVFSATPYFFKPRATLGVTAVNPAGNGGM